MDIGRFYARDVKVVYDFNVLDNFNVSSIKTAILFIAKKEKNKRTKY